MAKQIRSISLSEGTLVGVIFFCQTWYDNDSFPMLQRHIWPEDSVQNKSKIFAEEVFWHFWLAECSVQTTFWA